MIKKDKGIVFKIQNCDVQDIAVLFLSSLFILFSGSQVLFKDISHLRWNAAKGHIISSRIVSAFDEGKFIEKYAAEVYYEYKVGAVRFKDINVTSIDLGSKTKRPALEFFFAF